MIIDASNAWNITGGAFLATAQLIYIIQIIRKKITPSIITWLGWALLVGVSFIAQITQYGWNTVLIGHMFSGLGCGMIFLVSLLSKHYSINSKDWYYLLLGIICMVLYVATRDPWLTTIFSILADAILGMPTILKAIKDPITEKNLGWNLALACWTLTIITGIKQDPIFLIFPIYCLIFNGIMTYLTLNKRIRLLIPSSKR